MKKLLIPALLLAAASSYGALADASGDRLIDYQNWFTPGFNVSSDADYYGPPCPVQWTPVAFTDINRTWSGWYPNWGAFALGGPIVGPAMGTGLEINVEFTFLGETAGWWDNIGYRLNGVDHLLADGIQSLAPFASQQFGDYWETTINMGDTLDFFVVGTEVQTSPNGIVDPGTNRGGKYFVFDQSANTPASAAEQSYYGTLTPLTNTRVVDPVDGLYNQSWTVVGFEDIQTEFNSNIDYNDIVFAFRYGDIVPTGPDAVPEPSAYGLMGAAALAALAGYRRWRKV